MTDLRKAAEMALEALENVEDYGNKEQFDQNQIAIAALRQALEQPQFFYGQDPNVLPASDKGAGRD